MKYLYLVKSQFDNCATFGEPLGGFLPVPDWTRDRSQAAYFASKDAARFVANLCALAEARIVRVKR